MRQVEYWGERDWDAGDIFSFGIARAFRDNKKKCTRWETYSEPYEYPVTKYRDRERVIEKPGDLQYVIKGYYQEVKSVIKSWIAYWDYEVDVIKKIILHMKQILISKQKQKLSILIAEKTDSHLVIIFQKYGN